MGVVADGLERECFEVVKTALKTLDFYLRRRSSGLHTFQSFPEALPILLYLDLFRANSGGGEDERKITGLWWLTDIAGGSCLGRWLSSGLVM